jgi:hypothetical protein
LVGQHLLFSRAFNFETMYCNAMLIMI